MTRYLDIGHRFQTLGNGRPKFLRTEPLVICLATDCIPLFESEVSEYSTFILVIYVYDISMECVYVLMCAFVCMCVRGISYVHRPYILVHMDMQTDNTCGTY